MTTMRVPILITKKLVLHPFNDGDLKELETSIFADKDVIRYLPQREESPLDRARRALTYFTKHWEEHGYGAWAVTGLDDQLFYGYCGLNFLTENGEVEVLYALAKLYWGKGYATDAARASVGYGFEHIGLERIIGLAMPENIASRRVLEHSGMIFQRNAHYFGLDLVELAITREQYKADGDAYQIGYPEANG